MEVVRPFVNPLLDSSASVVGPEDWLLDDERQGLAMP